MKQLSQKLKSGIMKIIEVPIPSILDGRVLVKNHFSIISTGTESSTVKTARAGYIRKAIERPQQVMQIIDTLKVQGPMQTYRAVNKKLDSYLPLGYSCSGEVIAVGENVTGFKIGDKVACGGLTAFHAEVVTVPVNLCVKLEKDANLKQAAYNTLGAIAMQGIRQADLRLGETCAVIGLGLLGQLTSLLVNSSGAKVVGIDIDSAMVQIAANHSVDLALNRNESGCEDRIIQFTDGLGCDAVIITAASNSLDPINFAGTICRKKGTVVVVGNVPTGFDREPHFYKKELQIKMSCSYGPGRYDPNYEDRGLDYPNAYVRWTEKRNMQAFQSLIHSKKVDVSYLTSHTFKLDDAPKAYDMVLSKSEPFMGILIEYDTKKELNFRKVIVKPQTLKLQPSSVSIGFIGAGSYAQGKLLPNIPKKSFVALKGVLTSSGTSSRSVAERFGFEFSTSELKELLRNDDINTVFIATRHDSHAQYVMEALKTGKHVFVEKPLCLTEEELGKIFELLDNYNYKELSNDDTNQTICKSTNHPILMVGYNRRFAPLTQKLKKAFPGGPMAVIYRVNAGPIPANSWIQDIGIGGGRIIGEVCHFVDYLTFINGSLPVSVYASSMKDAQNLNDIMNVSLTFWNGSIGTISFLANGSKNLSKERIEVYGNGCTAVLDDFKALTIYEKGSKKLKKLFNQNKGQKSEVQAFVDAILNGTGSPISLEEIFSASLATFKIIESIRTGECVRLS